MSLCRRIAAEKWRKIAGSFQKYYATLRVRLNQDHIPIGFVCIRLELNQDIHTFTPWYREVAALAKPENGTIPQVNSSRQDAVTIVANPQGPGGQFARWPPSE